MKRNTQRQFRAAASDFSTTVEGRKSRPSRPSRPSAFEINALKADGCDFQLSTSRPKVDGQDSGARRQPMADQTHNQEAIRSLGEDDAFFSAIGRFLFEFSQLEYSLKVTVAEAVRLPDEHFNSITTR